MRFLCFYYDEKKCFYANTTVKSSVLSPCIFTLKKKIHASELKHIKPNILSRTSKERTLIFYQHTQRQDNFSPLKNKLESRVNVKLINEWDYIQEGKKTYFAVMNKIPTLLYLLSRMEPYGKKKS